MANKTLEVYYHDMLVGTLAEASDKRIAFQYSESWIKNGFTISPFSLPLTDTVYLPQIQNRDIFHGLFGVFADSLPDSWGEVLLDRYLRTKGVDPGSITVIDRLSFVGNSGMGALEYRPSRAADFSVNGIDYDELAGDCEKILSSQESNRLDVLYRLGGSSGGTRPKVLITEGGKDWIVKFPAKKDPSISGKREYDYSVCAKNCGILMTATELIPSKLGEGYFKTERFDRIGKEKVFSVTVAGLLEADFRAPSCDYSTFFKLIKILTRDNEKDKKQMYRMMCFNVLNHNRDDHTKNFSFLYTEEQGWRLSPAYDITYSDTYYGEQTTSVNGKGKDISDEDLISVGAAAKLTKKFCRETLDMIREESAVLSKYVLGVNYHKGKKSTYGERVAELK
jgi:serine/threonine-protein kinase HipA